MQLVFAVISRLFATQIEGWDRDRRFATSPLSLKASSKSSFTNMLVSEVSLSHNQTQ